MGTSEFASNILKGMIDDKYNVVAVYTKMDKPVGRKQEIKGSEVKKMAEEKNIPIFQPQKFNEDAISELKKIKPDLIVVAAYGKILPKEVLSIPGFGCINVHGSLLPKFRGPSPIQNALLYGESATGVTIMLMDEGMDTGDIISQEKLAIDKDDTAQSLFEKMSELGKELLLKTLPLWVERKLETRPQDNSQATLCQLIDREDGRIFWNEDAQTIYNKYRALYPWPGVFTYWKNGDKTIRLKLLEISMQRLSPQTTHAFGEVFTIGEGLGVQTSQGIILLSKVQPEGKKALNIADFINGYPTFIGSILQ